MKKEQLELKKKLNQLVAKYIHISNEYYQQGDLEKAKIYTDMKNDLLKLVEICIGRNRF